VRSESEGPRTSAASETLLAEIREQPDAWRRLLDESDAGIGALGGILAEHPPRLVRAAAHGTSDHAASYAVYVLRLLCDWTVVRDSVSLPVYYGATPPTAGELALALSQSGETPDVVQWLRAARANGALTVAVTNAPESALGREAEHVIALAAGEERSIAATKTYTNTLAALALIGAHVAGSGREMADDLRTTADLAQDALAKLEEPVGPVAEACADATRMYVVARGIELATAREIALKLTEVSYVAANAMTATSMAHGPVAALDPGFPAWAIASEEQTLPAVREAAARAHAAGAPVVATGPSAHALDEADFTLATPAAPHMLLSPLLSVLPGQLFARSLAIAKGIDPGAPRHLRKVTTAS